MDTHFFFRNKEASPPPARHRRTGVVLLVLAAALLTVLLTAWAKMRVCKKCGKYFAITGRTNAEYCDRVFDSKGRTCKDVGAIAKWTREKGTDDVFKAYRREYKKRFAWTKSGKILPEELYTWGERAREKKAECDSGKITLEEYTTWLKES